jgi:catechol 2,3-dioxygenase-like lactoylglutathione lyase family enzyme
MGRLDHVHIRVPDRAEAARWYAEHLGFEPVEAYDFWASGFEGGPDDYERVRRELVEADDIGVDRKWPRELYEAYRHGTS